MPANTECTQQLICGALAQRGTVDRREDDDLREKIETAIGKG